MSFTQVHVYPKFIGNSPLPPSGKSPNHKTKMLQKQWPVLLSGVTGL